MKILSFKLFESSNQFYEGISHNIFMSLYEKRILISESIVSEIKKMKFKRDYFIQPAYNDSLSIRISTADGNYVDTKHFKKTGGVSMMVTELHDEWFLVSWCRSESGEVKQSEYKCDQKEGLMELLKIIL